jgi:hypothetical protein
VALSKNTSMALAAAKQEMRMVDLWEPRHWWLILRGIVDPEMMESIACREEMALASDLRADSFRLASDCLNVV